MNQAHLHMLFNHLPIIIPIIGLLIMLGGFIFRSEVVKRTAYFVFVLGALCAIPAFYTGEGAEEIVEEMPGVGHRIIHEHEEIAEAFIIFAYILGGISLLGLWANRTLKTFSNIIGYITMIFAAVTIYFAAQTGLTGGEVRHTEIRDGYINPVNDSHENEENDDKD